MGNICHVSSFVTFTRFRNKN